MNDVRTLCAWMARRAPVRLADGRTGIITRVMTSYPEGDVQLLVWTDDAANDTGRPGLREVSAETVSGVAASPVSKTA